jgi:hypothetical protein
MLSLKARVKNEGAEVELYLHANDEMTPEERARLIQVIEESEEDIARGDCVDAIEFADRLLAKREAASR